jgi:hypothetical protein
MPTDDACNSEQSSDKTSLARELSSKAIAEIDDDKEEVGRSDG